MKEIQEILKKVSQFGADEKAILATVIDVVGSGYRRPGARMLIDENGYSIGTVSGGCLEADVLEHAKKVFETGDSTVITYDTTRDENSVFGLSMGCRGIVRILLEKVSKENRFFDYAESVLSARKSFSTATLISSNLEKQKVGARLFVTDTGVVNDDFKSEVSALIIENPALRSNESSAKLEIFDFGEVFFETISPPLNLLLFGAGYDALPVIKFAKELGWQVTAIDHRAAFANPVRLSEADKIIAAASENLSDDLFLDENSAAVIMTHNYERDRNILRRLLHSKCVYIGALGPKKRTEKLLEEIGETFGDEKLNRLHAPVGLDIGADSPEAIAVSVVAEIQAFLSNRNGGFLRDRQGSIYNRQPK